MKSIRKIRVWLLPALAVFLAGSLILSRVIRPDPQQHPVASVSPAEAERYVGSYAEVCGDVVQATFAREIGGGPVFLNFGDAHPNQDFTVVIWQRHHDRFEQPPHRLFRDQYVCAEGDITLHQGTPRIEVRDPARISIGLR
jgi:hypothetical protein